MSGHCVFVPQESHFCVLCHCCLKLHQNFISSRHKCIYFFIGNHLLLLPTPLCVHAVFRRAVWVVVAGGGVSTALTGRWTWWGGGTGSSCWPSSPPPPSWKDPQPSPPSPGPHTSTIRSDLHPVLFSVADPVGSEPFWSDPDPIYCPDPDPTIKIRETTKKSHK